MWLKEIEEKLPGLAKKPVEMVWAMKAPAFGKKNYIRKWKTIFPDARIDLIDRASHYLQEDCPEKIVAAIGRILDRL